MTPSSTAVDGAVRTAQSLPDLVAKLQRVDPDLAQQLTSKALIASKSVWGPLIVTTLAYASTKYGLGWSDDFVQLVSGAVLLAASAGFRWLTRSPIGGVFSSKGKTS